MLNAAVQRIQLHAASWAERRQGADALSVALGRRRIYILPSRFGLAYAVLVFAMLLGSMNYASSLGFALTFLLTGMGLVAMHHCHNNLLGTWVRFSGAKPAFAGAEAQFRITLGNKAAAPRYELRLKQEETTTRSVDLGPAETKTLDLTVPASRRGWIALGRFSVTTSHPGNLFRAWTWLHMEACCLVYPKLAPPGRPLPPSPDGEGNPGRREHGDEDFAGLRNASAGDPPRRIAWKAYARSDQLLIKQFASGEPTPTYLDWDSLAELDTEARLSQLARWCVDAANDGRPFGLRLPGTLIRPQCGPAHLHECLKCLALFEAAGK